MERNSNAVKRFKFIKQKKRFVFGKYDKLFVLVSLNVTKLVWEICIAFQQRPLYNIIIQKCAVPLLESVN